MDKNLKKIMIKNGNKDALKCLIYAVIACKDWDITNTPVAKEVLNNFSALEVFKEYSRFLKAKDKADKTRKAINNVLFKK